MSKVLMKTKSLVPTKQLLRELVVYRVTIRRSGGSEVNLYKYLNSQAEIKKCYSDKYVKEISYYEHPKKVDEKGSMVYEYELIDGKEIKEKLKLLRNLFYAQSACYEANKTDPDRQFNILKSLIDNRIYDRFITIEEENFSIPRIEITHTNEDEEYKWYNRLDCKTGKHGKKQYLDEKETKRAKGKYPHFDIEERYTVKITKYLVKPSFVSFMKQIDVPSWLPVHFKVTFKEVLEMLENLLEEHNKDGIEIDEFIDDWSNRLLKEAGIKVIPTRKAKADGGNE